MTPGILLFFNIGVPELFVIVLVVIIFFGSKKIPELMRGLGKGMNEFKNATSDIQQEIRKEASSIEQDMGFKRPRSNSGPSLEDQLNIKRSQPSPQVDIDIKPDAPKAPEQEEDGESNPPKT